MGAATRVSDIVVVGAGPFGLSIAAHLHARGADFRIFGEPLSTWRSHMPDGMMLKSDGFASSLSAPLPGRTFGDYCAARGIPYDDIAIPLTRQAFVDYGLEFQKRFVPTLEQRTVVALDRSPVGYRLELDDGEVLEARKVVLAVGITHFADMPEELKDLPGDLATHASAHHDVGGFRGRDVTVLGAGSSAVDLAAELQEAGAKVRLIARREKIHYHSAPTGRPPSLWRRIRHPRSGLGPGIRSRLCCDLPGFFRYLPPKLRLEVVRRHLGPASPFRMRARIEGKVDVMTGRALNAAEAAGGKVRLHVTSADGAAATVETDHVIAATGYQPDLRRLDFVAADLRGGLKALNHQPELSPYFESSSPGLYFVGIAAAASFGPLMRFMYGAEFAAPRVSAHLLRGAVR